MALLPSKMPSYSARGQKENFAVHVSLPLVAICLAHVVSKADQDQYVRQTGREPTLR